MHEQAMPRFGARAARPPRRGGFSLIELILVVLVIGVIAGLAAPMAGQNNTTRLREAAKLLVADLAFAQNESITHGDDLRLLVFDTDDHSYYLAAASDPETPLINPVTRRPYVTRFGEGRAAQLQGVTIQALSMDGDSGATDDRVGYGIYGQIDQAADATITLASGGSTITITIQASTGETTIGTLN